MTEYTGTLDAIIANINKDYSINICNEDDLCDWCIANPNITVLINSRF